MGRNLKSRGLIIYDVEQKYKGEIREVSPRVNRKIQKEFPNSRNIMCSIEGISSRSGSGLCTGINCSGDNTGGMEEALQVAAGADVIL